MTVVSVDFRSSLEQDLADDNHGRYAAQLISRTMSHLDKVDVGSLVSAYMALLDDEIDIDAYDKATVAVEILRCTALVEAVLDEARKTLRMRMALDVASTLLPRLNKKETS